MFSLAQYRAVRDRYNANAFFQGACAPPTALYHFDNSYADTMGFAADWVPRGAGTTLGTESKFGTGAVDFDAIEPGGASIDGEHANTTTAFAPSWLDAFTIDFWYWLDALPGPTDIPVIFGNGNISTLSQSYQVRFDQTILQFIWDIGVGQEIHSLTLPSLNAWHHVALINESFPGNFYFAVDGVLIGQFAAPNSPQTFGRVGTGAPFYLGYSGPTGDVMDGRVDELRSAPCAQWTTFPFTPPTAPYTPLV